MWLLDQWVERHIRDAQTSGEFDSIFPDAENPLCSMMTRIFRLNYALDTAY